MTLTPAASQCRQESADGEDPTKSHHSGDAALGVDLLVPVRVSNHDEP